MAEEAHGTSAAEATRQPDDAAFGAGTSDAGTGGGTSGGSVATADGPHLAGPVQVLRRSATNRKLAGVCGGLGAYTNIDPLVFRVLFAVSSLFGGFGVLLYGVAWLIIPEQGQNRSEIQRLGQGRGASAATAWAIVTTILGFLIFAAIINDRWSVVVWIIVIGAITFFILRSRDSSADRVGAWWSERSPTAPPPDWPGTAPAPSPAATTVVSADAASEVPAAAAAAGATTTAEPPQAPPAQAGAPPHLPAAAAPPAPQPPPKRRRSLLGLVTMSVTLLIAGVLVALDATDSVDISAVVILAAALVVLGIGLIVATWYGRARMLIIPGFALIISLTAVTTLESTWRGPVGEIDVEPVSATEIDNPYRASMGDITIDLRQLELRGSSVLIEASVGLGEIEVVYPDDIRLVADTDVEIGGVDRTPDDRGREVGGYVEILPRGQSQGTVRLDLNIGIGAISFREADRVPS